MDHSGSSATSKLIVTQVQRVLEEGGIATLATLIQGPANVGAKLLVEQSGETTGSLGADDLDEVVAGYTTTFLESREEAKRSCLVNLLRTLKALTISECCLSAFSPSHV